MLVSSASKYLDAGDEGQDVRPAEDGDDADAAEDSDGAVLVSVFWMLKMRARMYA